MPCLCPVTAIQAAETLRVSAIPDEAPTELIRKFKPLGEYLEKELGMPVKFTPVSDYAAVVEALASDRLDMAWLGGFTFVQTRLKTRNAIPLVQREQDEQFTSKFITADPAIKSLQDLKGKTFAFGSVSSTSGSLMPRYFMLKDGIEPEQFFSRIAYSGAHDATAAWVEAGKADAGVLNASVWDKLVAAGKVNTDKVRVASPPRRPTTTTTGLCAAPSIRPWPRRSRQRSSRSTRPTRNTRRSSTCRRPAASSRPSRKTTKASSKPRALPACSK
ncbi:hypothetical protein SSTU70S_07048 [Stutzerimonas stutzeri]